MSSRLHAPVSFSNGVQAKNRLWLAPMTNTQSHDDGSLSDDELHWLAMRAEGGFGVVETCAAHVSRDGQAWRGELGVFDDSLLPGLERLAGTLTERGTLGIVQLFHGGVRASAELTGTRTWSSNDDPEAAPNAERPRVGTEEDIRRVIGDFRAAAVRCEKAGFQGIELHGAHGYLFGQFLSSYNRRDDGWGGPLEGRARIIRETLREVKAAVSPSFVVGVRLSPEDYGNARGIDVDETVQVARWLADDGAHFVHISLWSYSRMTKKHPERHVVTMLREALPKRVVLVAAGGVWTHADAEAVLDKGADAIAVGRAAIANPTWAEKVVDPTWEPRRPPLTIAELRERGLNERFAGYMRNWKGFVAD